MAQVSSSVNPDNRPLPPGWSQHYDSGAGRWYYAQAGATHGTYAHPSGPIPLPPPRPVVPNANRSAVPVTTSSPPQRQPLTFAQQLYASSLAANNPNAALPAMMRQPVSSNASMSLPTVNSVNVNANTRSVTPVMPGPNNASGYSPVPSRSPNFLQSPATTLSPTSTVSSLTASSDEEYMYRHASEMRNTPPMTPPPPAEQRAHSSFSMPMPNVILNSDTSIARSRITTPVPPPALHLAGPGYDMGLLPPSNPPPPPSDEPINNITSNSGVPVHIIPPDNTRRSDTPPPAFALEDPGAFVPEPAPSDSVQTHTDVSALIDELPRQLDLSEELPVYGAASARADGQVELAWNGEMEEPEPVELSNTSTNAHVNAPPVASASTDSSTSTSSSDFGFGTEKGKAVLRLVGDEPDYSGAPASPLMSKKSLPSPPGSRPRGARPTSSSGSQSASPGPQEFYLESQSRAWDDYSQKRTGRSRAGSETQSPPGDALNYASSSSRGESSSYNGRMGSLGYAQALPTESSFRINEEPEYTRNPPRLPSPEVAPHSFEPEVPGYSQPAQVDDVPSYSASVDVREPWSPPLGTVHEQEDEAIPPPPPLPPMNTFMPLPPPAPPFPVSVEPNTFVPLPPPLPPSVHEEVNTFAPLPPPVNSRLPPPPPLHPHRFSLPLPPRSMIPPPKFPATSSSSPAVNTLNSTAPLLGPSLYSSSYPSAPLLPPRRVPPMSTKSVPSVFNNATGTKFNVPAHLHARSASTPASRIVSDYNMRNGRTTNANSTQERMTVASPPPDTFSPQTTGYSGTNFTTQFPPALPPKNVSTSPVQQIPVNVHRPSPRPYQPTPVSNGMNSYTRNPVPMPRLAEQPQAQPGTAPVPAAANAGIRHSRNFSALAGLGVGAGLGMLGGVLNSAMAGAGDFVGAMAGASDVLSAGGDVLNTIAAGSEIVNAFSGDSSSGGDDMTSLVAGMMGGGENSGGADYMGPLMEMLAQQQQQQEAMSINSGSTGNAFADIMSNYAAQMQQIQEQSQVQTQGSFDYLSQMQNILQSQSQNEEGGPLDILAQLQQSLAENQQAQQQPDYLQQALDDQQRMQEAQLQAQQQAYEQQLAAQQQQQAQLLQQQAQLQQQQQAQLEQHQTQLQQQQQAQLQQAQFAAQQQALEQQGQAQAQAQSQLAQAQANQAQQAQMTQQQQHALYQEQLARYNEQIQAQNDAHKASLLRQQQEYEAMMKAQQQQANPNQPVNGPLAPRPSSQQHHQHTVHSSQSPFHQQQTYSQTHHGHGYAASSHGHGSARSSHSGLSPPPPPPPSSQLHSTSQPQHSTIIPTYAPPDPNFHYTEHGPKVQPLLYVVDGSEANASVANMKMNAKLKQWNRFSVSQNTLGSIG